MSPARARSSAQGAATARPRHTAAARRRHAATGADAALLDGYLEILADVDRSGRQLTRKEINDRRAIGRQAAESSVGLGAVVDLYLTATCDAWGRLPGARSDRAHDVAASILRAANEAISAVAAGYDDAHGLAVRAEEALRREFIDDLLLGGEPGRLAERAARFGLQLAAHHVVALARGPEPFVEADQRTRRVETALRARLGTRNALITTKDGLFVCVLAGTTGPTAATVELDEHLRAVLHDDRPGAVGVGRPHPGPQGVARSYNEARLALDLAGRLGLPARRLRSADLLVYEVLGRDRAAIIDLVATVLAPLARARGGAQPLIDTLTAYFAAGNAAAAARTLHISVRALTYRLERVLQLTEYDATEPEQRYTLETAVLGARLLGWPAQPLPPGT